MIEQKKSITTKLTNLNKNKDQTCNLTFQLLKISSHWKSIM